MYTDIDVQLTDEHRAIQAAVHRFAAGHVRPAMAELDAAPAADAVLDPDGPWWRARREARSLGYHLAALPQEIGGLGLDPIGLHILIEELGWGAPGFALSTLADSFPAVAVLIHRPDNARLIEEIVQPFLADSEARLGSCVGLSEPDHGSDALWAFTREDPAGALALATRARPDGADWRVRGQKSAWVSNGPVASHAMTWLTVCDGDGTSRGGGIAIVPLDAAGVSRGPVTRLLGSRDFPQCALYFDDVRIPADYLLVGPDRYEAATDGFLNVGGLSVGIAFTGLARAAFEAALDHCRTRVQGGRPLVEHQAVQLKLFDMFTRVEAARALSRQAMRYCFVPQARVPIEYSTAVKVYCTQAAFEVAHAAVQLHGAAGLAHGSLVERLFRDARGGLIGDGCNDALALKRSGDLIRHYGT
ncbi:MAG: acyl-CoA/acyl-ACP dehydrogenase [Gammaproteobacteria bacterium]|nr:acyl-CoA/acyl-ACP dehydrogenase [Gammaproteobacteria bacterium]